MAEKASAKFIKNAWDSHSANEGERDRVRQAEKDCVAYEVWQAGMDNICFGLTPSPSRPSVIIIININFCVSSQKFDLNRFLSIN